MPNSKQAKKRHRQSEERRGANKSVRTAMRTAVKKVLAAESPDAALQGLPEAMKRVDKAARHHVIHRNTAARIKSRLTIKSRATTAATK